MSKLELSNKVARLIYPKYKNYASLILHNRLKRFFTSNSNHKFLFILSPPYCGSTLLNELISTSNSVSVNNCWGSREGQMLPTVKAVMFDHQDRWNPSHDFDWERIKKEWMKYWDLSYPILLEKSPPNIVRAKSIAKTFTPSYFIVFYRNPYAHCESLIRRNKVTPQNAAKFAIKSLMYQLENIQKLENVISISYEYLTMKPLEAIELLTREIPELNDLDIGRSFNAHNFKKEQSMKIQNLNGSKIKNLNKDQIEEINKVFLNHPELLAFFEYELIDNYVS